MDSRQIELRLRMAAPDEPAVLPPLVLPASGAYGRATPTVRFRRSAATPRDNRLVYAVVALVLLMVSVIAAGALRVLDNLFDQPVRVCSDARVIDEMCFSMRWPDDWHVLAPADWPVDSTEDHFVIDQAKLVVASVAIPCGAPVDPVPTAYQSGVPAAQPDPTVDAGQDCLRVGRLPAGAIRVTAEIVDRGRVRFGVDGPEVPDTAEPTPEMGWTERIGDRPARLTASTDFPASAAPLEIRTWEILVPGSIHRVLRITAEIADPDLVASRALVESMAHSIEFEGNVAPLVPEEAATAARLALDELDRGARTTSGSDFYACFPRDPGTQVGTIGSGLSLRLPAPVDVSCETAIEASIAGVWRLTLEMRWPAGDGYTAGGRIDEVFLEAGGRVIFGHPWTLDREPPPDAGEEALLPMAPRKLPPLLTGPLNLPVGSIVEMLPPGQYPEPDPNPSNDSLAPQLVGQRLYVLDGPRILGGDEWYQVQWTAGGSSIEVVWARGTFQGRPMLAVAEPACPPTPVDPEGLTSLTPAERMVCYGSGEITLATAFVADLPVEPIMCSSEDDPEPTTCPEVIGTPEWLTRVGRLRIFGRGGPEGPAPGLDAWLDPSLGSVPTNTWLTIRGHFDDPAAATCRWQDNGSPLFGTLPPTLQVLLCRERFVITGFEPTSAP